MIYSLRDLNFFFAVVNPTVIAQLASAHVSVLVFLSRINFKPFAALQQSHCKMHNWLLQCL